MKGKCKMCKLISYDKVKKFFNELANGKCVLHVNHIKKELCKSLNLSQDQLKANHGSAFVKVHMEALGFIYDTEMHSYIKEKRENNG